MELAATRWSVFQARVGFALVFAECNVVARERVARNAEAHRIR